MKHFCNKWYPGTDLAGVRVLPGPHVDPLAAGDAAARPCAPGPSLTPSHPGARLRFWRKRYLSIFKGLCTALCSVRLSDSIKVYSKYWTFQNWSGHNIHTENPADFTKEILAFYWIWFLDFDVQILGSWVIWQWVSKIFLFEVELACYEMCCLLYCIRLM